MANIPTSVRRRLTRLRKRRQRELKAPLVIRSNQPFRFDASFRVGGVGAEHETIHELTGLLPSYSHRKGDPVGRFHKTYRKEDIWILASPLGENASLDEHLMWLWGVLDPHKEFFRTLLEKAAWADVCLGCLSESAYPVLSVDSASLALLRELDVQLSFNFTCV